MVIRLQDYLVPSFSVFPFYDLGGCVHLLQNETYIILNRDPPSPKKRGQLEHGKWKTNHIHWKLGLRRGWTIRGTAMDCTGRDAGNVWCFQLWESWLVHLLGFGLRWQPSGYCLYILQKLTKSIKTIVSQKICMVYPNNKNWDFSKLGNTNLRDLERHPLINPQPTLSHSSILSRETQRRLLWWRWRCSHRGQWGRLLLGAWEWMRGPCWASVGILIMGAL